MALLFTFLFKVEKKDIRDKAPMLLLLYVRDILMFDLIDLDEKVYDLLTTTLLELHPILDLWC
ncbi:hypothetical protein IJU97_04050 [bacterium]|nr:hypothetical protein [bacterium]